MAAYYFHCTDGISFFADQQGRSITREDDILLAAMRTAEQVTQRLPSMSDWSGWLVSVYDELGQMVEVFDFPNLRPSLPSWFLDDADHEAARLVCAANARAGSSRHERAVRSSRSSSPMSGI